MHADMYKHQHMIGVVISIHQDRYSHKARGTKTAFVKLLQ
jgi:hypothetical protein